MKEEKNLKQSVHRISKPVYVEDPTFNDFKYSPYSRIPPANDNDAILKVPSKGCIRIVNAR